MLGAFNTFIEYVFNHIYIFLCMHVYIIGWDCKFFHRFDSYCDAEPLVSIQYIIIRVPDQWIATHPHVSLF